MVIVDVPANPVYMGSVLPQDTNFTAIWQAKERRIIRCDKANPFFCLMQMMVQKLSLVAVAVNRIHSFLWIQPQKIRIILCIRTEREILTGKINRTVDLTGNSTLIPPLCFSKNRHLLSDD